MARSYKLLTSLLVGVLKHQVKKHLGEEVLATIAEVGSEHLGDRLLDLLGAEVATAELAGKLGAAIESAADELERGHPNGFRLKIENAPAHVLQEVVDALDNLEKGDLLGRRLQSAVQDLVASTADVEPEQSLLISIQLYQAVLMAVLTIPELHPRSQDLLLQSRVWVLGEHLRRIEAMTRQQIMFRQHPGLDAIPGTPAARTRQELPVVALTADELRPGLAVGSGKFELLERLAMGGLSAVWLARVLDTNEKVVVKFLNNDLAARPEVVRSFYAQAHRIQGLPFITAPRVLHAPTEEGGHHFYVMEYLADFTGFDRLIDSREVPVGRRLRIVSEVARELHTLHVSGFIHGDVKPANILVSSHDEVRLIDFGALRGIGDHNMGEPLVFTYAYAHPALLTSPRGYSEASEFDRVTCMLRSVRPAIDVYPLGVMVVQAVDPGLWQNLGGRPRELLDSLVAPEELKAIIGRVLSSDFDHSPSALDVNVGIERALAAKRTT